MSKLENYYGKFCEDKRLLSRHGQVEYTTSMKYIHKYLKPKDRILDIGAGTGRYSVALSNEGYEVDAIELVKYNLGVLKAKKSNVKAYQGTALDLSRYQDETFDITLLFGPMYHLFSYEDKLKAISEAKRVTKTNGIIFVAYVMNEYSVLVHGFRDGHIKESLESGKLDETFQTQTNIDDLYSYIRLNTINKLNEDVAKAMDTMLDREILVSDSTVSSIRMKLDEFVKPEDMVSVRMKNENYHEKLTGEFYENEQPIIDAFNEGYLYLIEEYGWKSNADVITPFINFHRIAVPTPKTEENPSGIDIYYTFDTSQPHDAEEDWAWNSDQMERMN